MKKYIIVLSMLITTWFNPSLLYSIAASSDYQNTSIRIAPTTVGEDSIVDAIKYYSNLSKSDVNQYKLVPLGDIGTLGAFILGLYSAYATGNVAARAATNYAGTIQNVLKTNIGGYNLPEGAQKLMQNPATLVALGVLGGGFASYKMLYPRTRAGVLHKIDQFIDVCRSLERPDGIGIVQYQFQDVASLRMHLPQGWEGNDIRLYNALDNLAFQAECASTLLNQIQDAIKLLNFSKDDAEIQRKVDLMRGYTLALQNNKNLMLSIVGPELKHRADLANLKADTDIKVVGKWALYGGMAKGTVSSIWNGIKELYAHPEILAVLGLGWVTTKYLMPSIEAVRK